MGALMILIGIIGLIVAVVFFFKRMSATKRLDQLCGAGKQKLGELLPVLKETKESLGEIGDDGAIKESVTVMGTPKCDKPLTSPIGGLPCLYYSYRVTLKTTEVYYENDANGHQQRRERTHEETLDSGSSTVPSFTIDDGTGSIVVEPQDGKFENLIKSVDKSERNFQNPGMFNGSMMNIGNLSINVGNRFGNMGMGQNMSVDPNMSTANNVAAGIAAAAAGVAVAASMAAGNNMSMNNMNGPRPEMIKYSEEIMGLDRNLTVIGTVCDNMGDFRLRGTSKNKLIISTKSADDMLADTKKDIKTSGIVAIAAGAIGLVLLIIGLIL